MTRRTRYLLIAVGAPLLVVLLLAGPTLLNYFFPGRFVEPIDFKRLDFTCSREEDHVPEPTAQAEALFLKAYDTNARAMAGDRPDEPLLREAIKTYEQAAKAGHWRAARKLANVYTAGVGQGSGAVIKPDQVLALRYARQLVEMKVATGFNLMAIFAYEGWGVRQDERAALMYERRAADLGLREAQRHIGNKFLLEFNDLPPDQRVQIESVGRKMLSCSARQGLPEAASDLAAQYGAVEKDYPSSLFYYQQGGKMGDATCLYALYEWFKEGKFGYGPDLVRAEKYKSYSKRADLREGPFPELDKELPLPPPPNGGSYPPPEMGWPNEWTKL